jgi:drug/metabolite transporter (DMT)-like permease
MTKTRATLIGFSAILMWSLLSLLTVLSGTVPPFQLAAMTFAIAGALGVATWPFRPGAARALKQPAEVWALGVGGLFGYHALFFMALRLAPAAEAQLVSYLWPLLIVLGSALLPDERLKSHHVIGAMIALAGTVVLFVGRGGITFAQDYLPGFAAAFVAAFTWAIYSVLSRRFAEAPTDTVAGFCLATAVLAAVFHLLFEQTQWPKTAGQWFCGRGPRHRTGGCCVLRLGCRRQARRHPHSRCRLLRGAAAVDCVSRTCRLCGREHVTGAGGRARRWRRPARREGHDRT